MSHLVSAVGENKCLYSFPLQCLRLCHDEHKRLNVGCGGDVFWRGWECGRGLWVMVALQAEARTTNILVQLRASQMAIAEVRSLILCCHLSAAFVSSDIAGVGGD